MVEKVTDKIEPPNAICLTIFTYKKKIKMHTNYQFEIKLIFSSHCISRYPSNGINYKHYLIKIIKKKPNRIHLNSFRLVLVNNNIFKVIIIINGYYKLNKLGVCMNIFLYIPVIGLLDL